MPDLMTKQPKEKEGQTGHYSSRLAPFTGQEGEEGEGPVTAIDN